MQDIWALGVMAFELLTRTSLFAPFTPKEEILKAMSGEAKLPWEGGSAQATELRSRLGRLESSILRCLERDPLQRPSALEILKQWNTWLNESPNLLLSSPEQKAALPLLPSESAAIDGAQQPSAFAVPKLAAQTGGSQFGAGYRGRNGRDFQPSARAEGSSAQGGDSINWVLTLPKNGRGFSVGALELPELPVLSPLPEEDSEAARADTTQETGVASKGDDLSAQEK
jgi:serine/threonine protein kinase